MDLDYNFLKQLVQFPGSIFDSMTEFVNPLDKGIIGAGIVLVPIELPDNEPNTNKYGNLYRNGIKLSNTIFRVGGMCSGFKDRAYCNLIQYDDTIKSGGKHCIIDVNGDIVLISDDSFAYPYFLKGCIASMNKQYYNLKTGKAICKGDHTI